MYLHIRTKCKMSQRHELNSKPGLCAPKGDDIYFLISAQTNTNIPSTCISLVL